MEYRQHILLVVNSFDENQFIELNKTLELFRQNGAKFSLLYPIPQIPAYYFQIPSMVMIQDRLFKEAQTVLDKAGKMLNISKDDQWVEMGAFKTIVTRTASKLGIDFTLIVSEKIKENIIPENVEYSLGRFAHALSI